LNAELKAKGTSGKFAERIWDDPEWNERSDEEDEDAKIERIKLDLGKACSHAADTHMIVRRRPMYWLVKPATAPPLR